MRHLKIRSGINSRSQMPVGQRLISFVIENVPCLASAGKFWLLKFTQVKKKKREFIFWVCSEMSSGESDRSSKPRSIFPETREELFALCKEKINVKIFFELAANFPSLSTSATTSPFFFSFVLSPHGHRTFKNPEWV